MAGESKTPSFSQIRKRAGRLGVDTDQDGMITVPDRKHHRIPAADAAGLKQRNRGERMGKEWKAKRCLVKPHAVVDAQTRGAVALPVTDGPAGDVAGFRAPPGQSVDAAGAGGGAADAPGHSEDPGPDAPAG